LNIASSLAGRVAGDEDPKPNNTHFTHHHTHHKNNLSLRGETKNVSASSNKPN
jgi:hypothetical protein